LDACRSGEPGGVEFDLTVGWNQPLGVMVTITVPEDIEQYFEA
jgi:hypothetical protein